MRQPVQVIVIPFRRSTKDFEFLVLERSDHDFWQFVSGGLEDAESTEECAIRELREETGFRVETLIRLDSLSSIPKDIYKDHRSWSEDLFVVPEYSFGANVDGEPLLSKEHSQYKWLSFEPAKTQVKFDSNRTALWELNERLLQHSKLSANN